MGPREEGGRGGALFSLPKGIYCQQDLSLLMLTLVTWPVTWSLGHLTLVTLVTSKPPFPGHSLPLC